MKTNSLILIILFFILAGSAFLRVYKIENKPVWYDEAVSISNAEKPLNSYLTSFRLNYKPVYFLLLNLWISAFGENAFILRLFSVIWGILSIFFIYKLAEAVFNDKIIGIISAFLLGISVFHIFHCQQIRHFSFIMLLALVSFFCLVKFFKEGKNSCLIILTAVNILILNTHPYGLSVIIFEWVYGALFFRGKVLRPWLFAQAVISLFIILWLSFINAGYLGEMVWWIPKPGFSSILETFNTFSWGGQRYGLDDFTIPFSWIHWQIISSLIYLFLFFTGLKIKKGDPDRNNILLLVIWLLGTILLGFLFSRFSSASVYSIKHLIIALPAFIIIIARGISMLRKELRAWVLAVIFLLNINPLIIMYNNYFSVDWKKSGEYVKNSVKGGDTVIISTLSEVVPFMYYFNDKRPLLGDIDIYGKITEDNYKNNIFLARDSVLIIGIKQSGFENKSISSKQDFDEKVKSSGLVKRKGGLWVMLSRWTEPESRIAIRSYLDNNLVRKGLKEFQGVEVCYYENKK